MFEFLVSNKVSNYFQQIDKIVSEVKNNLKDTELKQFERVKELQKDINILKNQNRILTNKLELIEQALLSTKDEDVIKSYISNLKKQYE